MVAPGKVSIFGRCHPSLPHPPKSRIWDPRSALHCDALKRLAVFESSPIVSFRILWPPPSCQANWPRDKLHQCVLSLRAPRPGSVAKQAQAHPGNVQRSKGDEIEQGEFHAQHPVLEVGR